MLEEVKNLKDSTGSSGLAIKDNSLSGSHIKTNKLITALYMVTDIMDKEEPLRNKLRTLGTEIISDIYTLVTLSPKKIYLSDPDKGWNVETKISEILSFLDISSAVDLISEMNCSILKKEFLELQQSILGYKNYHNIKPVVLSEFLSEDSKGHDEYMSVESSHKGHKKEYMGTRIGVQKGSTLMKALRKFDGGNNPAPYEAVGFRLGFDMLKKQRRSEIIRVIKNNKDGLSIKDIASALRNSAVSSEEKLGGLGESKAGKTLQRELVSMVKDNILGKKGEKRWSKYFLLQL